MFNNKKEFNIWISNNHINIAKNKQNKNNADLLNTTCPHSLMNHDVM